MAGVGQPLFIDPMKKTISVNPVIDTGPGPGKYPINMKFMCALRASFRDGLTVYNHYYAGFARLY